MRRDLALGLFEVRRVLARLADGDAVLARVRQDVELMAELAADVARVGLDRIRLETATREDALVGRRQRRVVAEDGGTSTGSATP